VLCGYSPERIIAAGGLNACLEKVGAASVRVSELPAPPAEPTVPYSPLKEVEEINRRLEVPRSGDTLEKLPFEKPRTANEEVALYKRLTRDIIRAFRPDGPDPAARALLLTWRRIGVVQQGRNDATLSVSHVAALLHRLEPLVRFAVLAQLAYTQEGRLVSDQISDAELVESVASALLWDYPDVRRAVLGVLRTARPDAPAISPVVSGVDRRLQQTGRAPREWAVVKGDLAESGH
jgi:hypothetical protein